MPQLIIGETADGKKVAVRVTGDGSIVTASGESVVTPPGGGSHDFATDGSLVLTLSSGTAQVVVLQGVALPRMLYYTIDSGVSILTEVQGAPGGVWFPINFGAAGVLTSADSALSRMNSLDGPAYALRFTRTVGSGTTSKVEIA
jgi:hypothetical protein